MIEKTFIGNFSVLVYDNYSDFEGGIWIEKFANTYAEAEKIADKLFSRVCKNYL